MIEYLDLYKAFDVPVLTGVSLTVATGETVSIVGPSGTGKSVLLKMTNGLLVPDRGDVRIDGVVVGSGLSGNAINNPVYYGGLTVANHLVEVFWLQNSAVVPYFSANVVDACPDQFDRRCRPQAIHSVFAPHLLSLGVRLQDGDKDDAARASMGIQLGQVANRCDVRGLIEQREQRRVQAQARHARF